MECQRTALLLVLTLLQLCQAQNSPQQWYSAKINDEFHLQPISELFKNEPVFSTSKPIVVTQSSNSLDDVMDILSSTLAPPTTQFESTKLTTQQQQTFSTTPMPAGALYQKVRLDQFDPLQVDILPHLNYLQPILPSYVPPVQPLRQDIQKQQNEIQNQLVTEFPPQVTRKVVQPLPQQTFTPGLPLTTLFQPQTQTTQVKATSSSTLSSIPAVTNPSSPSTSFRPPNANYFLIYQQAQQSIPTFPPSLPPSGPGISEITIRESIPTTVPLPPRTSEAFSTTAALPISSISTTTPLPTTWLSTSPLPISTLSSSSVTVTPSSTLGLSNGGCITTTAPSLLLNGLNKKASGISYPLKIRVVAPSGSITNVNINPLTTTRRPLTTRRPVTTKTTTRRPTTRRTKKPKKNNYDRCLDGCKKVKDPLCAAPLSHRELDPQKLRGFPSVCHMACHNSYRKDPFEKVIEGSCSKLRTRIRLIDSRNKLKKDELRKNEYSVEQGQKTIIELTALA